MAVVELGANLLVSFLLALTTVWCVLLYRRLSRLRIERRDIEAFVAAVDAATQRAEAAIGGIRDAAADAQRMLAGQQELAQQRAAELTRLADNAGRMARRIEAALHQGARTMAESAVARERPEPVPAASADTATAQRRAEPRSAPPKIDPELLRALEALR